MTDPLQNLMEAIHIDRDPGRVWTFSSSPEHVPRWLGCMRGACRGPPRPRSISRLAGDGADSTQVTLEHSGWDQCEPEQIRAIRTALQGGWRSYVLPGLKSVVEAEARSVDVTASGQVD